jgi:hypothetical protein
MKVVKKQNNFKEENLKKDRKKEERMAYYCRICGVWHYPGSAIYYAHKRYSSQSPKPRRIVKRKKRSFWDRF